MCFIKISSEIFDHLLFPVKGTDQHLKGVKPIKSKQQQPGFPPAPKEFGEVEFVQYIESSCKWNTLKQF